MLFSGCIQQIAMNSLGGIMDNGFEVLNEEQDLGIAEQSIASNLKLLESILRSDPENSHYLLLASTGYSSYALGFVEDDSAARARLFYLRGKEFGMRILTHNEKFARALHGSAADFESALRSFSKDDLPALFWTAVGWGGYIRLSLTDPAALADIHRVEAMMRYVLDNDSAFFYGGPHFFLGTLAGSRPAMLGGNPAESQRHFQQCLRINGGTFLMTYIYYAKSYAVQMQDRQLFENCLSVVDTTSIDVLPAARLSNAIAKKKAVILRSQEENLF
jgi:hypothetical protein